MPRSLRSVAYSLLLSLTCCSDMVSEYRCYRHVLSMEAINNHLKKVYDIAGQ